MKAEKEWAKELLTLIIEECNGNETMIMRVLYNFYSGGTNIIESEGMLKVLRELRQSRTVRFQ